MYIKCQRRSNVCWVWLCFCSNFWCT